MLCFSYDLYSSLEADAELRELRVQNGYWRPISVKVGEKDWTEEKSCLQSTPIKPCQIDGDLWGKCCPPEQHTLGEMIRPHTPHGSGSAEAAQGKPWPQGKGLPAAQAVTEGWRLYYNHTPGCGAGSPPWGGRHSTFYRCGKGNSAIYLRTEGWSVAVLGTAELPCLSTSDICVCFNIYKVL